MTSGTSSSESGLVLWRTTNFGTCYPCVRFQSKIVQSIRSILHIITHLKFAQEWVPYIIHVRSTTYYLCSTAS